jgi:hypothetical protein
MAKVNDYLEMKGIKATQAQINSAIEALGFSGNLTSEQVEAVGQKLSSVLAVAPSAIADPIAPYQTESTRNRRPSRSLPVKRQQVQEQQVQDQQAIAISFQGLKATDSDSAEDQLDEAVADGEAHAQAIVTARTAATLEALKQGNASYHRVVKAATSRPVSSSVVSDAVAKVQQSSLFNDEWLTSLLG